MDEAALQRLADAGPTALLPPRIASTARLAGPLRPLDVLDLGESRAVALLRGDDEHVVVPLCGDARAVAGDGVAAGLLDVIVAGADRGRFCPVVLGASPAPGRTPPATREVAMEVHQSNESTVVDGAVVLKLHPRTGIGPQPALTIAAHLAEVGFAETPAPIGALRWIDDDDEVLVAGATTYLPGARDGWEWFVEAVLAAVDGSATWPVADAAALGGLVGRFHAAMATPSTVFPQPVGTASAGRWHAGALVTLDGALDETDGPEGERLRALAAPTREVLMGLDLPGETPVVRIHGDLHVGQVLRWEGGDALSDFDGNPLAATVERNAPGPAARDVASMARAIDHVGPICQQRRPDRVADIGAWIAEAREAFLAAYRPLAPQGVFDERLLVPLEVAQECHEYRYAAAFAPRWRYVPDLALPDLLELAG